MQWGATSELPFATEGLRGCGGLIKRSPSDFEVEEVPAYEPCGEGDHLFLWLQKSGVSADGLIRHVAEALQIPSSEVGCAGLKDKQGLTRQYLSVPASSEPHLGALGSDRISLLRAARHTNKLKTGHLRGNRFRVVVRGVHADALELAQRGVERLRKVGVPNFYGEQRFGINGETPRIGLDLLAGRDSPQLRQAKRSRRSFLRRLALSSVQSALFNHYLSQRMADGLLHRVIDGEVMQVCASGGPFWVDDREREQARFDAHEIVPAGPMFGPKMRLCRDGAAAREQAVLREAGIDMAAFGGFGKLLRGTRRPNLVWVDDLQVAGAPTDDGEPEALELLFTLPAGSYATVVLREICKSAEG